MSLLILPAPNWAELVGGDDETAWTADRHRKATLASGMAMDLKRVRDHLRKFKALYHATEETIRLPFAPWWYASLAGFSQKTLQNTKKGPKDFGMSMKPMGFLSALDRLHDAQSSNGKLTEKVKRNLKPFVNWINYEIDQTFPLSDRTEEGALVRVALILGGRIIGQGQNQGGTETVSLVRDYLLTSLLARGHVAEARANTKDPWALCRVAADASGKSWLRLDQRLIMDFTCGGNRPDIMIILDGTVIAVGEIKGRKDTSNTWESWMPQLVDHMKTWTAQFPSAARLLLGTQITTEMVNGKSKLGTLREGLQGLYSSGQLNGIYNLAHMFSAQQNIKKNLEQLPEALAEVL